LTSNTFKRLVLDSYTFSENRNDPCTYKEPVKDLLQFRISKSNRMYLRVHSVSCHCSSQNLLVCSHQNQITIKE
jgi:hypothetical protein